MGFFVFDGNNHIFNDLVSQLPNGTVYFKEKNIIPYIKVVTYVEQFPNNYIPGTNVDIYINDKFYETKQILPIQAMYLKIKPPYGKFKIRTEINSEVYRDEIYYSINIFAYFVILSQTYIFDYTEIFNMFGNIYDKYLQDDMLFNKIGWWYDFARPSGWSMADYRNIMIGSTTNIQIHHLFLNSMTYYSMKELVKSFTGIYPNIFTYRDVEGWIIPDTIPTGAPPWDTMPLYWEFKEYWIWDDREITGIVDVAGVDLDGLDLTLIIGVTTYTVNFTTTTGGTDIMNQINAVTGGGASVVIVGPQEFIKISTGAGQVIKFISGASLPLLGFSQFSDDDFIDADNDIITLYDEQFVWNKIDLLIYNGSKPIIETVTRTGNIKDKLIHRDVIDTIAHPLSISGYVKGTDYQLIEDPTDSNDWYIEWLNPNVSTTGTGDVAGVDLGGEDIELNINNEIVTFTFNTTTGGTDIANQINARFTGTPASVVTAGPVENIKLDGYAIKIISGSALSILGFTAGAQIGVPLQNDKYIVIYSYFIREELDPLIELNKPAYLLINKFYVE